MNFIHDLTAESKVATGLIIAEKLFYIIKSNEPGYQTGRGLLMTVGNGLQEKM